MKISREIKTAILVIASILLFIWGYYFLKGRDLFTDYKLVYVQYDNIEGLTLSAPVTINGFTVGKVNKFDIDKKTGRLTVELQIKNDFPIGKSSIAELYSPSPFLGGKQIAILPNLQDSALINDGDYLRASNKAGLTDQLADQIKPIKEKVEKLLENANLMVVNLNQVFDEKTKQNLRSSIANLNETLAEFKGASIKVNDMLAENKTKIGSTITNFDKTAANFAKVSDTIAKADIGKSIRKLEATLASVDKIMSDLNSGKGTVGKLIKDETLYNNFAKTSKELELLLQDLRLNPTRYINVSLFGKKNKPYKVPAEDPATSKL
ncbi:MAG: organic solvent ABC transporter substrate-binding protein [Flavobacterium sp. BFFFF1]|uniref:MlaD family protein n=1 Tax=Flavobacterium sp. BFFFF1 TaxID=2015557 RepID=UPI000BC6E264|nr:MlaD family protein [Flavobacterium sp. BFFFF1]OYU80072.1 MAG: organic solvent ABC transporter substrate-binding protein [Flavobacterium sp. BFFFF1]